MPFISHRDLKDYDRKENAYQFLYKTKEIETFKGERRTVFANPLYYLRIFGRDRKTGTVSATYARVILPILDVFIKSFDEMTILEAYDVVDWSNSDYEYLNRKQIYRELKMMGVKHNLITPFDKVAIFNYCKYDYDYEKTLRAIRRSPMIPIKYKKADLETTLYRFGILGIANGDTTEEYLKNNSLESEAGFKFANDDLLTLKAMSNYGVNLNADKYWILKEVQEIENRRGRAFTKRWFYDRLDNTTRIAMKQLENPFSDENYKKDEVIY